MKSVSILSAVAAITSLASAIPFHKRDVVVITETQMVRTTVEIVKTVLVGPSGDQPTTVPAVQPQAISTPLPDVEHHKTHYPEPSPAPSLAAPSVFSPAPAPAPVPAPAKTRKPVTTTPAAVNAQPATTSSASSRTSSSTSSSPQPSPGGPSGQFSGDGTHYAVGLGSCGWTSTPNENIVALSYLMMNNGPNPNTNPLCGKTISITYGGVTQTAKVVDTCEGCDQESIDMSNGLFKQFARLGVGRLYNVNWSFVQ